MRQQLREPTLPEQQNFRLRLQRWWRQHRWSVVIVGWLVAILLGFVGFLIEQKNQEGSWSVLGILYLTFQLFTLESGSYFGVGAMNPALEVARWMAPLVAAFTAAEAVASLFYDKWQLWRARSLRGHVIVCGLGEKGLLLTRAFREMGLPVFCIEKDDLNDFIAPARALGAVVLMGNATEPETLTQAQIQTARYLIAVCTEDGVNAEIATVARALVNGAGHRGSGGGSSSSSRPPLTCVTHVVNPQLWHLLRRWEIAGAGDTFRMQFFNTYDIGARALLSAHPPFPRSRSHPEYLPHLLVVGGGQMGQSVLLHALREWCERFEITVGGEGAGAAAAAPPARLHVTVVDRQVPSVMAWLRLRHPDLDRFCDLNAVEMDPASPEFQRAAFLEAGAGGEGFGPVTIAYVCLPDDSECLSAALALHRRGHANCLPVVACLVRDVGLASLLQGEEIRALEDADADTLFGFSLLERTCTPELVLGGTTEVLARAIHEHYLHRHADERDQGLASGATPANAVPWEALSEEWRESNRHQAEHIGQKLHAIGCSIAPVLDWGDGTFPFTPEEVETMAEMEHERWRDERVQQGWSYGPQRDEAKRTNPSLLPWNELPEEAREFNRDTVRRIPDMLRRSGFQVYRLTGSQQ